MATRKPKAAAEAVESIFEPSPSDGIPDPFKTLGDAILALAGALELAASRDGKAVAKGRLIAQVRGLLEGKQ